jgi:hypothetical protein
MKKVIASDELIRDDQTVSLEGCSRALIINKGEVDCKINNDIVESGDGKSFPFFENATYDQELKIEFFPQNGVKLIVVQKFFLSEKQC